jgi:hypothetical protein
LPPPSRASRPPAQRAATGPVAEAADQVAADGVPTDPAVAPEPSAVRGPWPSRPPRNGRPPTAADVVTLQAARGLSLVTVLLSTDPGQRLRPDDAARLEALVAEAGRRLRLELPGEAAERLRDRVRVLALEASLVAPRQALALFTGPMTSRWFTLPVPVRDRVVVDPTFATRDLVRALHRTPRHVLLVITEREARLFEGADDQLRPVGRRFPLKAEDLPSRGAYLRAVDAALGAHLRSRPAPLVLAGVERLAADFRRTSRWTARLAGIVPGSHLELPLPELARRVRPVIDDYLRSREREALQRLRSLPPARVASGLDAAWLASRSERPDMLVVEEDLFLPARLSDDGDHLLPADDVDAPDVLDDAVDELIEAVLRRGGWVALASPGALSAHGGVALTVHRP